MCISNTFNFFEIHSARKTVTFWGMGIMAGEIPIISEIEELISKFDLPFDLSYWDFGR